MLSNLAIPLVILSGLGVLLAMIIVLAAFVRGRAAAGAAGLLLICAFFGAVFFFFAAPARRTRMHAGTWTTPRVMVETVTDTTHDHELDVKWAELEEKSARMAEAALDRASKAKEAGESIALRYVAPPAPADVSSPPAPALPEDSVVVRAKLKEALDKRVIRFKESVRKPGLRGGLGTGLTGLAIAAFLFVGYVFLDASTRGQFTWSLRILSAVAFGLIFAAAAMLRH